MSKLVINLDQIPENLGKQITDYLESVKPEYIHTLSKAGDTIEEIGKALYRLSSKPELIANNPRREDIAEDIFKAVTSVKKYVDELTEEMTSEYGEDFLDGLPDEETSDSIKEILRMISDVR